MFKKDGDMPSRDQINAAAASLRHPLASRDFLDGVEALRHATTAEVIEWVNVIERKAIGLLSAAWTADYARGVIALAVMLGVNIDTLLMTAKRTWVTVQRYELIGALELSSQEDQVLLIK